MSFKIYFIFFSVLILIFSIFFKLFIVGFKISNPCMNINITNYSRDIKKLNPPIPLLLSTDINLIYPTIVTITSACVNASPYTSYKFYVFISNDFNEEQKDIFNTVHSDYPHCSVELKEIPKNYMELFNYDKIRTATYYRLFAAKILKNEDKIIYVDGDVIIRKDLTDLYKVNMKDLHFRGFLDSEKYDMTKLGFDPKISICAGVLLMNLKQMREDDYYKKLEIFVKKNNVNILKYDQTIINILFPNKVGSLEPVYGIYNFYSVNSVKNYHKQLQSNQLLKYDLNKMIDSILGNVSIVHLTHRPKPWDRIYYDSLWFHKRNNFSYKNEWWNYVTKTQLCNSIYSFYLNGKKINYSFLDHFKY